MSTILSRTISDQTSPAVESFLNAAAVGWNAIEAGKRYEAIARDPRYFQFANIPNRILRCLESCATVRHPETIQARLLAYYLFIGVVDDEIEAGVFQIGEKILSRLANPLPCFDEDTRTSKSLFMIEVLKQHIDPVSQPQVLRKFRDLHRANVAERLALTMKAYIEQRKLVGSLTAELSYLLIREFLSSQLIDCCRLMKDVGAVGCLVDSLIDARADRQAGALAFRPTVSDFVFLCVTTIFDGTKILLKHPPMMQLFVKAIRDNFYDRRRSLAS